MTRFIAVLAALAIALPAAAEEASPAAPAPAPAGAPAASEAPAASPTAQAEPEKAAAEGSTGASEITPAATEQAKEATALAPPAAEVKSEAPVEKSRKKKRENSLAIFEFETNEKSVAEKAEALGVLVATRIAQRPNARVLGVDQVKAALGLEKQKSLLGCTDSSCMAEISGALGVRYILQGRLDRFGRKYVVTGVLLDARNAQSLARLREDVFNDEDLPTAADRIGDGAADAIGLALGTEAALVDDQSTAPFAPDWHLNLKFGNTLSALRDVSNLALRIDLEGDYYIKPFLLAFLEAGVVIGRAEATATSPGGTFSLVPVSAGLKYVFREDRDLRPYAGLGLGLGILAQIVDAQADSSKIGLNFNGLVGLAYLPWRRVGFNIEASLDLTGLTVSQASNVFFGFNTNFGMLVLF